MRGGESLKEWLSLSAGGLGISGLGLGAGALKRCKEMHVTEAQESSAVRLAVLDATDVRPCKLVSLDVTGLPWLSVFWVRLRRQGWEEGGGGAATRGCFCRRFQGLATS